MRRFLLTMVICMTSMLSALAVDTYELVTDASSLAVGDQFVIVYKPAEGDAQVMTTQSGNFRTYAAVTITNDKITELPNGAQVVTLEESGDTDYPWLLNVGTDNSGNKVYLNSPSASNYLKTAELGTTGFYADITISSTTTNIKMNRVKSGKNYEIQFNANKNQERFSCYTGTQKSILMYRLNAGEAPSVEAPKFSLVEGMEGFSVAMTTETEGAEIYYTEDGTVPTAESTKYTAPVEVWFKTTFKAVAIKDGESSRVATYEANPPYILPDFTPLSDFEPENGESIPVIIKGSMTVLYQSGSYLYLKAGNSYMLVYGALDKVFTNGDTFSRLEGDFILFNGQPEIQNPEIVGDVTPGSPVAPTPAYLDEVAQNRLCHYLTIKNVNISGVVEGSKDATITDEYGTEVALRNNFGLTLENLENCTIVGFVGIYTNKSGVTTIQFNPTEIIPAAPAAPEPVVTVDGAPVTGSTINLKENEEAVIEFNLAEGVEVYYNITETAAEEIAPAAEEEMEFTKYTEPLRISKSSILTYYSVANGVKSEVATLTISGTTAITEIMAGEGEAEYFDLMGRRVENPANGLYIRRAAGKVEKVLVK